MSHPQAEIHISPIKEVNSGIWSLFVAATIFLGLRVWCKVAWRHGLWYDDYVLIASWVAFLITCALTSVQFAVGYVTKTWGDRMLILVSTSSCFTLVAQFWSKTAFAVTLLRMTNQWQKIVLWFIIATLNIYMVVKLFVQWAKYCDQDAFQNYWRMPGFCLDYDVVDQIKAGGNVANIVADFVLALFPWMVTWNLSIRRYEKIGLCITMSLGILVAIVATVRTWWQWDPKININHHDKYFFWRQGMLIIWYQAEVAGTIIVQSIPVLRPLIQEIRTANTSRKLTSAEGRYTTRGGIKNRHHMDERDDNMWLGTMGTTHTTVGRGSMTPSEVLIAIQASHTAPLESLPSPSEYLGPPSNHPKTSLSPNENWPLKS
ncbi:uncharacterized protein BCR38DRAFT_350039 [Pseudomassariella vexata]|uniref:Rhodopsin domain-containing protein n=1 Tax=Pseudomassariella vexata TaxID=1141098 RepID=A0A1Y2DLV5_9PEZI|nr:uncharacterized protein BCR38DRAFT_350039 [Pseudomassariella vexata]ORY60240.1 hypothetical protein BCR38DRAFT_350039 [Pseudomassariella vexata]